LRSKRIEEQYGNVRRVWLMDRGVPTEEVLAEMRAADPPVHYLVDTPKGRLTRLEKHLVAKPWQEARPGVQSLQGSYFRPFLEARKSSERALIAVIQEAWIGGVSTRRVDDLVQAMGLSGISKSQVSKLCKEIDERVHAFLDRPLAGEWPYLWLDAT
jgi:hypothetical protein